MDGTRWLGVAAGLAAVAALAVPRPAQACGGTFCDAGPMTMPVDQTGETILFAVDETHVEAHIQIQYDSMTEANQFAWIVPVTAIPEFSVGSQSLFTNLQNSTVPSYGYIQQFENCGGGSGGGGFDGGWCDGTGGAGGSTGGGFDDTGDDGGTTGGGTEVVGQATVGAFDIVVLQSTGADELMMWLSANGYFEDPAAIPILDQYIAEGHLFAAFRLTNGANIGEIHPISIRYEGTEPCIPIRLTQIAAQDDMDIRAFFLGSQRAVPSNYRHIRWNPVKLDWINLGANYKEVVTLAVDEIGVDGHGFVTEYAGPSDIVDTTGLFSGAWDELPFGTAVPEDVVGLLESQGLMTCDGSTCSFDHPLIEGLLGTYLPVPPGLTADEFYNCVSCFVGMLPPGVWDGPAFATAMRERIIDPGQHALDLVLNNPVLTRLYTTISPAEMTIDPTFAMRDDLDTVDRTGAIGTLNNPCVGAQQMDLPGSSYFVNLARFNVWPDISPDTMPWLEYAEEFVDGAAPIVVVDNTTLISDLVDQWNAATLDSGPQHDCHDTGSFTSGPGGGTVGDGPTGPGPWPTGGTGAGAADDGGGSGCSCRSESDGGSAGWMLLGLAALGLGRRRRRA